MFSRDTQRFNAEAAEGGASAGGNPAAEPNPAQLAAVQEKARQLLESGKLPTSVFLCGTDQGILIFNPGGGQGTVVPLFSNPFAAADYLRATGSPGRVGQLAGERLPAAAAEWLQGGVGAAAFDRCPRCPQMLTVPLATAAKWTPEDLAKIWAFTLASRFVPGRIRLQSAMRHMAAGEHSSARADFEYIRDHFDCSIPYLHQMVGMLAGNAGDQAARAAAAERLKEFGPEFDTPLDFSPERFAKAIVGLALTFEIPMNPDAASNPL